MPSNSSPKRHTKTTTKTIAKKPAGHDLWSQLVEQREKAKAATPDEPKAPSVIFVGGRQSGKSTLMQGYFTKDKDDIPVPKPTPCIDYAYARAGQNEELTRLWEVGGGRPLSRLLSIPLSPASVENCLVVIVLDLSKPGKLITELEFWLNAVRITVADAVEKLKKQNASAAGKLLEQSKQRMQNHKDADKINNLLVPILIVANKYDMIKDQEVSANRRENEGWGVVVCVCLSVPSFCEFSLEL